MLFRKRKINPKRVLRCFLYCSSHRQTNYKRYSRKAKKIKKIQLIFCKFQIFLMPEKQLKNATHKQNIVNGELMFIRAKKFFANRPNYFSLSDSSIILVMRVLETLKVSHCYYFTRF